MMRQGDVGNVRAGVGILMVVMICAADTGSNIVNVMNISQYLTETSFYDY